MTTPLRISAESWHYSLYLRWVERQKRSWWWRHTTEATRRQRIPDHRCDYAEIVIKEAVRAGLDWSLAVLVRFLAMPLRKYGRLTVYPWSLVVVLVGIVALPFDPWRSVGAVLMISGMPIFSWRTDGNSILNVWSFFLGIGFVAVGLELLMGASPSMQDSLPPVPITVGSVLLACLLFAGGFVVVRILLYVEARLLVPAGPRKRGASFLQVASSSFRAIWNHACPPIILPED